MPVRRSVVIRDVDQRLVRRDGDRLEPWRCSVSSKLARQRKRDSAREMFERQRVAARQKAESRSEPDTRTLTGGSPLFERCRDSALMFERQRVSRDSADAAGGERGSEAAVGLVYRTARFARVVSVSYRDVWRSGDAVVGRYVLRLVMLFVCLVSVVRELVCVR